MDIALIIVSALLLVFGLFSCLVPVLPGPLISYAGLLLLQGVSTVQFSGLFLVGMLALALAANTLDALLPVLGVQKSRGTRGGTIGCVIGVLAGMVFFPPLGIVLGPLLGALVGEIIAGSTAKTALLSAWYSFLGLLAGTAIKLAVSGIFVWFFISSIAKTLQ